MNQRENELMAYLGNRNDGSKMRASFKLIGWPLHMGVFGLVMLFYALPRSESAGDALLFLLVGLGFLASAVYLGTAPVGIASSGRKRREFLKSLRASGKLEAMLDDFEASVSCPAFIKGQLRMGKTYLYKADADLLHDPIVSMLYPLPFDQITQIYVQETRGSTWLGSTRGPIQSQTLRARTISSSPSSLLLAELDKNADISREMPELLRLFQQRNPKITLGVTQTHIVTYSD